MYDETRWHQQRIDFALVECTNKGQPTIALHRVCCFPLGQAVSALRLDFACSPTKKEIGSAIWSSENKGCSALGSCWDWTLVPDSLTNVQLSALYSQSSWQSRPLEHARPLGSDAIMMLL